MILPTYKIIILSDVTPESTVITGQGIEQTLEKVRAWMWDELARQRLEAAPRSCQEDFDRFLVKNALHLENPEISAEVFKAYEATWKEEKR